MSSTDDERVENESSKVLGIGGGTFAIFFLALMVALMWILTAPQVGPAKGFIRGISVMTFIIIFLILFLSDREDQYQDEGEKIEAYDSYIVPRIAIACMMILSSILSVLFMTCIHFSKVITGSSQEVDSTSLW